MESSLNGNDPQSTTPERNKKKSHISNQNSEFTSNKKSFVEMNEDVSPESQRVMNLKSQRETAGWNVRPNANVNAMPSRRTQGRQMTTQSPSNNKSPLPKSGSRKKSPLNLAQAYNKNQLNQLKIQKIENHLAKTSQVSSQAEVPIQPSTPTLFSSSANSREGSAYRKMKVQKELERLSEDFDQKEENKSHQRLNTHQVEERKRSPVEKPNEQPPVKRQKSLVMKKLENKFPDGSLSNKLKEMQGIRELQLDTRSVSPKPKPVVPQPKPPIQIEVAHSIPIVIEKRPKSPVASFKKNINKTQFANSGGANTPKVIKQEKGYQYIASNIQPNKMAEEIPVLPDVKYYQPPDQIIQKQKIKQMGSKSSMDLNKEERKMIKMGTIMAMKPGVKEDPYDTKKIERDSRHQQKFGILPDIYLMQSSKQEDEPSKILQHDLSISIESTSSLQSEYAPVDLFELLVINSNGTAYTVWHEIVDFLCIISSFIYIHYAAYRHQDATQYVIMTVIESAFVLDFIMNFILDYPDQTNDSKKVKDIGKISTRYLQSKQFYYDAIALAPFQWLKMNRNRQYLLYIIKIIRLKRGFGNFDVKEYLGYYKDHQNKNLEDLIQTDPIEANRTDIDLTKIEKIVMMSYLLTLLKITIIISSCSYLFGMIFKFILEVQNDIMNWDNFAVDPSAEQPEHFTQFYNMDERPQYDTMIILLYFSFTSLTTVGFGDFNPRGDFERFYIAFGLLFGVSTFSYIMGLFIEIIEKFKEFNAAPGYADDLQMFFGTLKYYNLNKQIDLKMKRKIEEYFDYRWDNDKNNVVNNDDYVGFMQQLPQYVQDNLLNEFLYSEFLLIYRSTTFYYPKTKTKVTHCPFSFDDPPYRNLMFAILCNLEPIRWDKGTILFQELDEFNTANFIMGNVHFYVGYLINKQPCFKIKLKNMEIGAYGITFSKLSSFIYKTSQACDGYFIRKQNWLDALAQPDDEELEECVKARLKYRYENVIEKNLNTIKKMQLKELAEKQKSQSVIILTENKYSPENAQMMKAERKKQMKISTTLHMPKETNEKLLDGESNYKEVKVVEINEEKHEVVPQENAILKNEKVVEQQTQKVVSIMEKMEVYEEIFMEKYLELQEENQRIKSQIEDKYENSKMGKLLKAQNELKELMEKYKILEEKCQ